MRYPDQLLDTTSSDIGVCLGMSVAFHLLLILWNPTLLRGSFEPPHNPLVSIDMIVESPGPGGDMPAAPKKMTLMETLKDMLMKPKEEQIAHISPEQPVNRVAAPVQPALKERNMPRPIAMQFQPRSQAEDLASQASANKIDVKGPNAPVVPTAGPSLTAKQFGGIRAKDLPFQVGTDQAISGGGPTVPIAVGNKSAKAALNYGGATLSESKNRPVGIRPGIGSTVSDLNSVGAGAPATIAVSGTGGTGNAPTGSRSGSVLQDRPGTGGGLVSRGMFGSGRGGGVGTGVEGIPSAAASLDAQLGSASGSGTGKKQSKGFEISGPLGNRPIVRKVIPQYPAWAEEQGIIGSVRLFFRVTTDGRVRSDIRVTKTTGYPQLDQLGIDALKQWQFATVGGPSDDADNQWGIITFNFSLAS